MGEVYGVKVRLERILLSSCAPFPVDGLEARILSLGCVKLSPFTFASFRAKFLGVELGGRRLLCREITCHPKRRWRGRAGRRTQGGGRRRWRWRSGGRNDIHRLVKDLSKLLSL